ncbi:boron transporter 4-like protein [Tanacetum coccineum]
MSAWCEKDDPNDLMRMVSIPDRMGPLDDMNDLGNIRQYALPKLFHIHYLRELDAAEYEEIVGSPSHAPSFNLREMDNAIPVNDEGDVSICGAEILDQLTTSRGELKTQSAVSSLGERGFWKMFHGKLYDKCPTKFKAVGNFITVSYKSNKGNKTEEVQAATNVRVETLYVQVGIQDGSRDYTDGDTPWAKDATNAYAQ